jgi:hypothetical protein
MRDFYDQLIPSLSDNRLSRYGDDDPSTTHVDIVARYIHNMDVCQHLLPALHLFEVALRNNVHKALATRFGDDAWYDAPHLLRLVQRKQIEQTRQRLASEGKAATADRIVSELTLGFWVGLFSSPYERELWHRHPTLLKSIFPNAPRHARTRSSLGGRLGELRRLRNRVAHHERVNHRHCVESQFTDLARVLFWLSPGARYLLESSYSMKLPRFALARKRATRCFLGRVAQAR